MLKLVALAATYPLFEYLREEYNLKDNANSSFLFPALFTIVLVVSRIVERSSQNKVALTDGASAVSKGVADSKITPQQAQAAVGAEKSLLLQESVAPAPSKLTIPTGSAHRPQLTALNLKKQASSKSAPFPHSATIPTFSFNKEPKSFSSHRRKNSLSIDTVPRQTIFKAIVSSRPRLERTDSGNSPDQVKFAAQVVSRLESPVTMGFTNTEVTISDSHAAKYVNALQSPCFYHSHFDDAVNIQKVLEEIQDEDQQLNHSRLVQTAAGVREVARQLARRTVKTAASNVMIVTKARDNYLVSLTRDVAQWLMATPRYGKNSGVNVYVDLKLKKSRRFDAEGLIQENPEFADKLKYWTPNLCWTSPEKFDLVLTLGGDGTVLFTSWLFQRVVPPVLSFSLGSLGFLTNFQFEQYREHLNSILDDGMRVNLKMRFTCTVYRHQDDGTTKEAEQFEVLNELVIDRGPSPYVSQLELYGDDDLITVIQADGCIFSTPTGSTAYSLSAGGSLVHPDIPAILLTPICPHTLSFRPMIFNDSMQLRVCVPRDSRATAWCAFDGKGRLELKQGDMVTIAASQYPFPTVLSSKTEWIDAVSRTLRWNSRAAAQKGWDGDSAVGGSEAGEPEFDIDTDNAVYLDAEGGEASPNSIGPGGIVKRNMALFNS